MLLDVLYETNVDNDEYIAVISESLILQNSKAYTSFYCHSHCHHSF